MYNVEITRTGPRRLAGLAHHGAYYRIGETIRRLHPLMTGKTTVICAYYDDPALTSEADLQSFAGAGFGWNKPLPEGFAELRMAGGRCAVLHHTGPYDSIPAAWAQLKHWIKAAAEIPAAAPAYEVYRSTGPGDLKTDICWPLT